MVEAEVCEKILAGELMAGATAVCLVMHANQMQNAMSLAKMNYTNNMTRATGR